MSTADGLFVTLTKYLSCVIFISEVINMKDYEIEEINKLPEKYRPLSAWSFWGYGLLFSIPIAGFILLIVFSLSNSNICRRNFARSYFCTLVLCVIIFLVLLATGVLGAFLQR